jgi:hypothetical protein
LTSRILVQYHIYFFFFVCNNDPPDPIIIIITTKKEEVLNNNFDLKLSIMSSNILRLPLIFLTSTTMIGFWLLSIPTVAGFATTGGTSNHQTQQGSSILTPHRPSKLQLNSMSSDSSDSGSFENSNGWDIESARRQLEDLMGGTNNYARGDDTSAVAEMLPFRFTEQPNNQLTAIGRLRRTAEIQLLSQLEDAVEAADALNDLWLNERGARSARDLKKADDIFQQGESSWNKAEDSFLDLIHEHGPHWVEPLHRLAMLYYLQGRLDEARELEEFVLQNKPWHIGSLSNYVRIAESQHDTNTALKWAARRLPQGDLRRARWAQRAAYHAMNVLTRDERRLQAFLGEPNVMPQDEPFQ